MMIDERSIEEQLQRIIFGLSSCGIVVEADSNFRHQPAPKTWRGRHGWMTRRSEIWLWLGSCHYFNVIIWQLRTLNDSRALTWLFILWGTTSRPLFVRPNCALNSLTFRVMRWDPHSLRRSTERKRNDLKFIITIMIENYLLVRFPFIHSLSFILPDRSSAL